MRAHTRGSILCVPVLGLTDFVNYLVAAKSLCSYGVCSRALPCVRSLCAARPLSTSAEQVIKLKCIS